jgi:hypothetical protein
MHDFPRRRLRLSGRSGHRHMDRFLCGGPRLQNCGDVRVRAGEAIVQPAPVTEAGQTRKPALGRRVKEPEDFLRGKIQRNERRVRPHPDLYNLASLVVALRVLPLARIHQLRERRLETEAIVRRGVNVRGPRGTAGSRVPSPAAGSSEWW